MVDARASCYGESYLHVAIRKNDAQMVQLLLSNACNVNTGDVLGCTPLMDAAEVGSVKIVNMLLQHNAYPNREDREHRTAISYCLDDANKSNFFEIALSLINHGANPNYGGKYTDRTLLHYAAAQGKLDVVKHLVEDLQANIEILDADGRTALRYAMEYERQDVIDYFRIIVPENNLYKYVNRSRCECIIL
eukprot:UN12914